MNWIRINRVLAQASLPEGYRFELLRRAEVAGLVDAIEAWFPDISIGGASCYMREDFFAEKVYFAEAPFDKVDGVDDAKRDRHVLVVLLKKGDELAGLFSCERDLDTLALYGRLAVVGPEHRGARLCQACIQLGEAIGRAIGMELIYGMATLKIPQVQMAFENLGWQLIGITPGYDREMVAPGVVKRVYEAVYARVLVSEGALLRPQPQNLTPQTRAFFRLLFPEQGLQCA